MLYKHTRQAIHDATGVEILSGEEDWCSYGTRIDKTSKGNHLKIASNLEAGIVLRAIDHLRPRIGSLLMYIYGADQKETYANIVQEALYLRLYLKAPEDELDTLRVLCRKVIDDYGLRVHSNRKIEKEIYQSMLGVKKRDWYRRPELKSGKGLSWHARVCECLNLMTQWEQEGIPKVAGIRQEVFDQGKMTRMGTMRERIRG